MNVSSLPEVASCMQARPFPRIVERYGFNHRFRALPFTDHFSAMAFAKLAYRQCLRDIKAVLSAQSAKQ